LVGTSFAASADFVFQQRIAPVQALENVVGGSIVQCSFSFQSFYLKEDKTHGLPAIILLANWVLVIQSIDQNSLR